MRYRKENKRGHHAHANLNIIDDGWAIYKVIEERPDRECDSDCPRRANSAAECTCSRAIETVEDLVAVVDTEAMADFFINSHVALEVHAALVKGCQSFEEEDIGADGCYLMAAIMKGSFCEWEDDRPIIKLLKEELGDKHPVWGHIQITKEQG